MKTLFDLLFPPHCLVCTQPASHFLCTSCWLLSSLSDPISRCRHCFAELTYKTDLCLDCRHKQTIPAPRAHVFDLEAPASNLPLDLNLAPFAYYLFTQLDWPNPTYLVPMPDAPSLRFASHLSRYLPIPFARALTSSLNYRPDHLEEDQILLLLSAKNSLPALLTASDSLTQAYPQKLHILSLIEPSIS